MKLYSRSYCFILLCTTIEKKNNRNNKSNCVYIEPHLLFVPFSLQLNMSQVVKNQFNRLLDSSIVLLGTKKIVPAMVFAKIGRYSAYIEHYYMQTPHMIILVVEPVSKPQNRGYVPAWREELLEVILLKLASTALVAGDYYTYINCFMARYFVSIDLLRKLAFALEEGFTIDEEDPDLNVDMHYLFKNFA